jgi:hypothetical protein
MIDRAINGGYIYREDLQPNDSQSVFRTGLKLIYGEMNLLTEINVIGWILSGY